MNILVTGIFDPEYNRTKVLLEGLKLDRNINLICYPFQKKSKLVKNKLKELAKTADFVFLPSFTHLQVKFVKRITKLPLIFDPLISRYLTKVFDYKQVFRFSPRALKNYLKDKLAFEAAYIIIADTEEHKKYYVKTFKIQDNKIKVLPVGVIKNDFFNLDKKNKEKFIIGFYGGFIPLQGTKYIIEAANLLSKEKDVFFSLIGKGFEFEKMQKLAKQYDLKNIDFKGWLKYSELNNAINEFDVCLGIFGNTPKAEIVIPNKVFHYAACGKAIISKKTKAIIEIFTESENILLTESDPEDIVKKIITLKKNKTEREKLANNAQKLIYNNYSEKNIAEIFIKILKEFKLKNSEI